MGDGGGVATEVACCSSRDVQSSWRTGSSAVRSPRSRWSRDEPARGGRASSSALSTISPNRSLIPIPVQATRDGSLALESLARKGFCHYVDGRVELGSPGRRDLAPREVNARRRRPRRWSRRRTGRQLGQRRRSALEVGDREAPRAPDLGRACVDDGAAAGRSLASPRRPRSLQSRGGRALPACGAQDRHAPSGPGRGVASTPRPGGRHPDRALLSRSARPAAERRSLVRAPAGASRSLPRRRPGDVSAQRRERQDLRAPRTGTTSAPRSNVAEMPRPPRKWWRAGSSPSAPTSP